MDWTCNEEAKPRTISLPGGIGKNDHRWKDALPAKLNRKIRETINDHIQEPKNISQVIINLRCLRITLARS